jgi:hypothetical protein
VTVGAFETALPMRKVMSQTSNDGEAGYKTREHGGSAYTVPSDLYRGREVSGPSGRRAWGPRALERRPKLSPRLSACCTTL